ncbi:MAG: DUF3870 domain-containing protein, partial [Eubacteriales bacterium]
NLLINRNFSREFEIIVNDIVTYYQALPQKTLLSALKDAHNKYTLYKKKKQDPIPDKLRENLKLRCI